MENQIINNEEKTLSESMIQNIKATAPWMKFLAIMSFIGAGLLFVFALVSISKSSEYGRYYDYYRIDSTPFIINAIVYIIVAIIVCIIGGYLYKSSDAYRNFCNSSDTNSLETALLMQKKYWKAVGIVTIVYLSLLVIVLLFIVSNSNSYYF